jgi:regulator of ribonuclease activity B
MSNNNTFFTKDIYDTKIGLDVNGDVLESIYSSGVTPETNLPIEFFYLSDEEGKLKTLGLHLLEEFPQYTDLKIQPYEDKFELYGITHPIKMDLASVNEWNQKMWDIGYRFDCKLDGWQVGT